VSSPRNADARVDRVIRFFENISPQDASTERTAALYTPDARFKDPFNEVRGPQAIAAVFGHMYVALDAPRFVVVNAIAQGPQCFLTWDFTFRFKRFSPTVAQRIHGSSHVVFADDGRISLHRDYWDAAEELYEKLPAVGVLMRWLKRRANG
jgi:limonene-1,2-epoxide hydrolase